MVKKWWVTKTYHCQIGDYPCREFCRIDDIGPDCSDCCVYHEWKNPENITEEE